MSAVRTFAAAATRLLFPPICEVCSQSVPDGRLCTTCGDLLRKASEGDRCSRCGGSTGPNLPVGVACHRCRRDSFAFTGVIALGSYVDLLADLCQRIKEERHHRLAWALADVLFDCRHRELEAAHATGVVATPLHWFRRLRRGYNQSHKIASRLAQRLQIPCRPGWLTRTKATPMQTQLSPTERRQNVRHAFISRLPKRARGQTILLVDDVLTTGATCNWAARALLDAGAAKVTVACIARGEG